MFDCICSFEKLEVGKKKKKKKGFFLPLTSREELSLTLPPEDIVVAHGLQGLLHTKQSGVPLT